MVISTGVSSVFSRHPDENRDLVRLCRGLVSGGCNGIPAEITHKNFQFLRGPIRRYDEERCRSDEERCRYDGERARYAGMTREKTKKGCVSAPNNKIR